MRFRLLGFCVLIVFCSVYPQQSFLEKTNSSLVYRRDVSNIPLNGLIAYYPFNGNANDESGNNNNGTVFGAALIADRFGNVNSAYQFDGSSTYISVPHTSTLNFTGQQEFTICTWIKKTGEGNGNPRVVTKGDDSGYEITLGTKYFFGGGLGFGIYSNTSVSGNWDFVVCVKKATQGLIYVNGVLDITTTIPGGNTYSTTDNLTFGKKSGASFDYFQGSLDNIRLYSRALTYAEILSLYQESQNSTNITSPIGGENWLTNSIQNITWGSAGVINVKIEYSTDNGTNWSTITASTLASANSYSWTVPNVIGTSNKIRISDASNSSLSSTSASFTISAPSNSGKWVTQNSGTTNELRNVSFIDAYNGIVVGVSGTILSTTDGGNTWTQQSSGTSSVLSSVCMISSSTATIVGHGGTILRTTNGGASWTSQTSGVTNDLTSVSFVTSSIGTIVGGEGTILRTTDAGATWQKQTSGIGTPLYSVSFVDANNGTAVGHYAILKTTNGGTTWQSYGSVSTWYDAVSFTDVNNGTAVGGNGTILRTTDGGTTWVPQTSGTSLELSGVSFTDANNGTAVGGNGTILKTTNGGSTWITQSSGTTNYLVSTDFTSADIGTAVGLGGTILRTLGQTNIALLAPNGGERILASSSYSITWSSIGINLINLEYTSNNGTTWSNIENNVSASSGLYYWSVPNSAGTNFKVRISSSSDATITAISNSIFAVYKSISAIGASPYYYYPMNATSDDIVSGNNGTMSGVTSAPDRFETSSGAVSLNSTTSSIELPDKFFFGADKTAHSFSFWFYPTSTEGLIWGKSGNLQSTALQMLTGGQLYFQWTHPAPGSPSTAVFSDATTVAGVISQNAWNHVAVNYTNSLITVYINGQAVSTANRTLDNSHSVTDNTKTYSLIDWGQTVGGSANGKNGFGSVSDPTLSNGSFTGKLDEVKIYDTSLTASLIRQLYSLDVIKLTTFNTGGDFVPGVSYAITWKSLQTSTLKIEYSTDNGTNWTAIGTGVIASLGTYAWTIPYALSTNCKLRITDETDALKYAVSTSSFTIINQQPSVSSMKTAASTGSNSIKFGDALVTVEGFWKALFPVTVTYYPGTAPPNSTVPSGFVRLSNYYWNVNVPGNTINSGGAISCSVIDLPGVVNPLTVKWLRRMSESDPWINLGSNYATGTLKSAVSFTNFGEFALGTTNAENPLPVELSSFRAQIIRHFVRFTWETATEITNSEYRLERTKTPLKYDKDGKVLHYWGAWVAVQKLKGAGTSYSPKSYTAYDRSVVENGVYGYRLLQVDYDGKENLVTETEVDLDFTPTTFVLEQNYPNPFNPSTTIKYGLPVNSHITINIYNSLGQLITKVADEVQTAGYHTAVWNGSNFASGIYFYELKAEGFKTVKKLMLVK